MRSASDTIEGSRLVLSTKQRLIIALSGFGLVSLVIFTVLDVLSLELYFISMYVWFLFVLEYLPGQFVRPAWLRRLHWIAIAGFVGFLYILVDWVQTVLASGAG